MADTVWASNVNADIAAPSVEKIATGWLDEEYPPNEWFNWLQNRTDTRLNNLEDSHVKLVEQLDQHERSGRSTYNNNSQYTVPSYIVGDNTLKVYVDGILCNKGETYAEVGNTGTTSTKIKWLQEIDNTYDIYCTAPMLG